MATSLDALEALLQFREGALTRRSTTAGSHSSRLAVPVPMPVPNPLDPTQPHIIEGDSPTPIIRRRAFDNGTYSAFSPKRAKPLAAPMVPNPLVAPVAEKYPVQTGPSRIAAAKALAPLCTLSKVASHGFAMNPVAAPTPMHSHSMPQQELGTEEVRTDKIRDALNSKPQRGKKRQNLNDFERQELTRTRNREHAKSTRMKKKARMQELVDIEHKYLLLGEKEDLNLRRRQRLVDFVESAGRMHSTCAIASRLIQHASEVIQNAEFSVMDDVALTTEHSGVVKISARGTDVESGEPKTLSGVVCADFTPRKAGVCAVSLCWAAPKSTTSSANFFPSISYLSFES